MRDRPWTSAEAFLADERESFRPFEAILELERQDLDLGPRVHGWSARDLLAHLAGWHEVAAEVARELIVAPTSARKVAADEEWEARGNELNEEIRQEWEQLTVDDFRARARAATYDLRAAMATLPLSRWWDSVEYLDYFTSEMQGHYLDHRAALDKVLGRDEA